MPGPVWRRFAWLAAAALGLAGCASSPLKHSAATQPVAAQTIPNVTGIPACDAYLASYQACHLAARIYPSEQIDAHYQTMRASLLQSAQDSTIRAQLSARCLALSMQQRGALQGHDCAAEPVIATH
jgi:hypothetical protein